VPHHGDSRLGIILSLVCWFVCAQDNWKTTIVIIIIYYEIVHRVHTKTQNRKKEKSKSKHTCLLTRLNQLTAKKLITSRILFLDKIHLLSLFYQSLHAIKSRYGHANEIFTIDWQQPKDRV